LTNLKQKFLDATKNILENNLELVNPPYCDEKIVLVYDLNSPLSIELSNAYIKNLERNKNTLIINFNEVDKELLKQDLLSLEENSTVILVQSTNFRLENFRIRMSLYNI
jgi:aminopeptidase